MYKRVWKWGLAACLGGALSLAGCHTPATQHPRQVQGQAQQSQNTTAARPGGSATSSALSSPYGSHVPHQEVVVAKSEESQPEPAPALPPDPPPPEDVTGFPAIPEAPGGGAMVASNHAEDYRWLCGEVEHYRVTKGWRLNYAGPGEEDAHGGSVLLVGEGKFLDALQEGQRVRVTGRFLNPESAVAGAPYKVETLEVLSK